MIKGMNDQPRSAEEEQARDGSDLVSSAPKGSVRQKAFHRAQQAYEIAKRLGAGLGRTLGGLTTERITAIFTAVIAGATIWNVVVVKNSLGIMQGQLNEMRDEQRPWVFADKIELASSVTWDEYGIKVKLRWTLINSGHLPASDIQINYLTRGRPPFAVVSYPDSAKKACSQPMGDMGLAIFPGSTALSLISATTITNGEIEEASKNIRPASQFISPVIVACVAYRDASKREHHTSYVLLLSRAEKGEAFHAVPSDKEAFKRADIIVQQYPAGGAPPD